MRRAGNAPAAAILRRPFLLAVEDAQDLDPHRLSPHLIDDDEWRSRNNQLARSTPAAGAAGLRVIAQQHVGALADSERHREGAARAFKLDAIEYRVERRFGLPEPDDGNAQAPRVFKRAMRASRRPMTSSCGTHSAAGSAASRRPCSTCSRNHRSCPAASFFAFMRAA